MENKEYGIRPLDHKVLAVAVEGAVKDWAAYVGAVKGDNHSKEAHEVALHGNKLPKEIAEILFPEFKHLRWRV